MGDELVEAVVRAIAELTLRLAHVTAQSASRKPSSAESGSNPSLRQCSNWVRFVNPTACGATGLFLKPIFLLKERFLSEYPESDDETLQNTLEGITGLHEMIALVIRSALVDEALQSGLRMRLEHMRERLTRFEERRAKKRHLALEAMLEAGSASLSSPTLPPPLRAAQLRWFGPREHRSRDLLDSPAPDARSPLSPRRTEARPRNLGRRAFQSQTDSRSEDQVMAFTEAQPGGQARWQARQDASGARHRAHLRGRMARDR